MGNVISVSRELFDRIGAVDDSDPGGKLPARLGGILFAIEPQLRAAYRGTLAEVLETATLNLTIEERWKRWRTMPPISYYEHAMPPYILLLLFWNWLSEAPFTDGESAALVEAVIVGIVGYRLVDVHLDDGYLGAEAIVLGGHLIRCHERRLAALFGYEKSQGVIDRYAALYTSIEYAEKAARWKACPFRWDQAEKLGWKCAPILAVVHLLLERAGKSRSHIESVTGGLCQLGVTLQIRDDLQDSVNDLTNGTETLAVSGFYEWNKGRPVDARRVGEFLDQKRVRLCFHTAIGMANSASSTFDTVGEPLFRLLAEQMRGSALRVPWPGPTALAG